VAGLPFAQLLPLVDQHSPLEWTQVIDEQNAVQVVDLVLNCACFEVFGLDPNPFVSELRGLDHDALCSVHIAENVRNGETAFLTPFLSFALDDFGVDQHELIVVLGLHHGYPAGDTDLIRRETDPVFSVHRIEEIFYQPDDLVLYLTDAFGLLP
jgi:hypothetical protein